MAIQSKMLNLAKVKAKLAKLPEKVRRSVEVQLDIEAAELAAAVKRAVPVRTGTLRDTVRVEPGKHELSKIVIVGDTPATRKRVRQGVLDNDFAEAKKSGGFKGEYDYALGIEFGHRTVGGEHVAALPFFFPTYRARRRGMRRRLSAAARKTIKQDYPG